MIEKFSEFLNDVYKVGAYGDSKAFDRLKTAGHLETGQDSMGGFLVPEQTAAEIFDIALEESIVRPRARVIPMESDVLKVNVLAASSHASTVFGGITIAIPDEAGALTASVPSVKQIVLHAVPLTFFCYMSNEWMSDSGIQVEAFLRLAFGSALAFYADDYYINGTGSRQPLGILNAPATIEIAKESSPAQAADTLVWKNIIKMDERLYAGSQRNAIWLINSECKRQLFDMAATAETHNSINMAGGPEGPYMLWHPVIPTEKCKKLGDKGDIYLADFSKYIIGNRSLAISVSTEYSFNTDETCWKMIYRTDGQPMLSSAIIPKNSTSSQTVSPFVTLAERA